MKGGSEDPFSTLFTGSITAKIGGSIMPIIDTSKNGERRTIPINATLHSTLEELYKGTKKQPRRIDVPYVFYELDANGNGKPYHSVRNGFTSACRKAGIRDFRFHDLRHTCGSHLAMKGCDLRTIQEILGHKTVSMTLRYSHLSKAHMENSVNKLDCIFSGNAEYTKTIQKGVPANG